MAARSKTPARFLRNPESIRVQCGALCWRMTGKDLKVLLVTSRDTGRWVIPKGWQIEGLTQQASAAREAWEEAGVQGIVADDPVGLFAYDKVMTPDKAIACIVSVYPLQVTHLRRRYPEMTQRQRRWFSPLKAAKKVIEPDLRLILQLFTPLRPAADLPEDAAVPNGAGQS